MSKEQMIKWTKEYNKQYAKERYHRLKRLGMCTQCGRVSTITRLCSICREKDNKVHREGLKRCKEERPEIYNKIWGKERYMRRKDQVSKYYKGRNFKLKQQVFEHYGNKCVCCGEEELVFLTLDHINNDGNKERLTLKSKGGASFYRWVIKNNYPNRYQILCWNCNLGRCILGECPHKRKEGDD